MSLQTKGRRRNAGSDAAEPSSPPDVSAAAKEKKSANWGVDGGGSAQMSSDRPSTAAAALVDDGDIPVIPDLEDMDDGAGGASGIAHAPSVALHLPTQLDADADFVIPKPPVPNVNLSILYAALSPPSRIVDLDENWDTQRLFDRLKSELQLEQDMMLPASK